MSEEIEKTLAERGTRYGAFTGHAEITQDIKKVLHDSHNWYNDKLAPDQKEALEMIAHKIGRILNGDPNYHDSWHDIVGYTKLVADRLAPPKTAEPKMTMSADNEDYGDAQSVRMTFENGAVVTQVGQLLRIVCGSNQAQGSADEWLSMVPLLKEASSELLKSVDDPLKRIAELESDLLRAKAAWDSSFAQAMENGQRVSASSVIFLSAREADLINRVLLAGNVTGLTPADDVARIGLMRRLHEFFQSPLRLRSSNEKPTECICPTNWTVRGCPTHDPRSLLQFDGLRRHVPEEGCVVKEPGGSPDASSGLDPTYYRP
jgi:hypothetical protein